MHPKYAQFEIDLGAAMVNVGCGTRGAGFRTSASGKECESSVRLCTRL